MAPFIARLQYLTTRKLWPFSLAPLSQSLRRDVPYPKLQAMRRTVERSSHDRHTNPGGTIRVSKGKRENDVVIQELSHPVSEAKKRRILLREDPIAVDNFKDFDAAISYQCGDGMYF
ncbi:hypothetical protein PV08_10450 [Exophiala spinifera]|uniref:Uncharacterized protein n=1 Tax=Exophiala spinifera TaxID=91928 RepID=A0A0D2AXI0_9EURO|nr:uncharacterized protein PV08_10450 [Exophiala spinifera]KIW11150.1 hypothetical protein PV08_10450 [Exophiala spinifera]